MCVCVCVCVSEKGEIHWMNVEGGVCASDAVND